VGIVCLPSTHTAVCLSAWLPACVWMVEREAVRFCFRQPSFVRYCDVAFSCIRVSLPLWASLSSVGNRRVSAHVWCRCFGVAVWRQRCPQREADRQDSICSVMIPCQHTHTLVSLSVGVGVGGCPTHNTVRWWGPFDICLCVMIVHPHTRGPRVDGWLNGSVAVSILCVVLWVWLPTFLSLCLWAAAWRIGE